MTKRQSDLVTQGCQVSLKALMFALQSLDTGQVMAVVVSVEGLVLLLDPLFSFICISEKAQTTRVNAVKDVQTSGGVL